MAEDQDMTEHGRAEGNGADQQQNPPHVVHAGDTPPHVLHAGDTPPQVLHAGGEGQDRQGHEGEQQRGDGQQQQRAADQSQEAASRVIRAGARATDQAGQAARSGARVAEGAASAFGTVTQATARLMQDGMLSPLQVADIKALSQSLDSMVQTGLILARGSQQALTQWVDYGRQATDRNVRALNDLGRIRSMKDLVTWQTELMKDNIEDWLHSSIQIYELSAQAAKEAVDKMRESGMHAAQSAQQRGQA